VDRSRLVALVVGALAVLLFVTVATAPPARIAERQPSLPWELPTLDLSAAVPTTTLAEGLQPQDDELATSRTWGVFADVLRYALIVVLAIMVTRLLRRAWASRPRLRWDRRPGDVEFALLDELADALVADADAQYAALRSGEARNAIVACWLRLETAVESAGVEPDPAFTSAELTAAVLGRFALDPEPAARLAALYREARFSTHEMGDDQRAAAIAALDAFHAELRASTATAP
jgi:hypothetical protein